MGDVALSSAAPDLLTLVSTPATRRRARITAGAVAETVAGSVPPNLRRHRTGVICAQHRYAPSIRHVARWASPLSHGVVKAHLTSYRMSFNRFIAGLLTMGHKLRSVLMASTLVVGFVTVAGAETRPVVLELFTSEGCSSCPPAELIVNELAQRPNVLPLSFHVDYWDDLGWRDRYSLASATERQRVYAQTLRRSSVYTPQAVIDGSRDVVGSQRAAVMDAVSGHRDGVAISVSATGGTIQIRVGAGSDAAQRRCVTGGVICGRPPRPSGEARIPVAL